MSMTEDYKPTAQTADNDRRDGGKRVDDGQHDVVRGEDDPLAELIRIVKEEDPFADILADVRRKEPQAAQPAPPPAAAEMVAPQAGLPEYKEPVFAAPPRRAPQPVSPQQAAGTPPARTVRAVRPTIKQPQRPVDPQPQPPGRSFAELARQTAAAVEPFERPPAAAPVRPPAPEAVAAPPRRLADAPAAAQRPDEPVLNEPPPLDPVDLERALRDFRNVPADALRAHDGWDLPPDGSPIGFAHHEAPIYPAAGVSASNAPDNEGYTPVDPYDDPAFGAFDDEVYDGGPQQHQLSAAHIAAADLDAPKRRRGTFVAVGVLLGLAILGGGFAFVFNSGDSTPQGVPPVIKAETKPVKVIPLEQPAKVAAKQQPLVYEVVSGESTQRPARIVSREEEAVDLSKIQAKENARLNDNGASPATAQPVRTVTVTPLAPVAAPPGETNSGLAPAPRRVRTLTVRPDGSIVPDTTASVQTAARPAVAAPVLAAQPQQPAAAAVPTPAVRPVAPAAAPTRVASANSTTVQPVRPVSNAPLALNPFAGGQTRSAAPASAAPVRQTVARATPAAIAPATAVSSDANAGNGDFVVQLAARKSEEQATGAYNELRAKYGALLGRYQPLIQRADLAERGVYYRVRVGPMSTADAANELCSQLKSAGLNDCLVRRR